MPDARSPLRARESSARAPGPLARWTSRNGWVGPLVLEYHAISETWNVHRAVTPAQLRRQLGHLVRSGLRGATFTEAAERPRSTEPLLVVTFDDAHLSVLDHAFPILESLGLPGTVFVVTDYADDGRPLRWPSQSEQAKPQTDSDFAGMTWSQLAQLRDAGWEIGSHTRTHPRLTLLSDEDLDDELGGSRAACERALAAPCTSLAYPFGDFDARVVRKAAEAGYSVAAIEGLARPSPLMWPRVGIYRRDSMLRFRAKVSPALRYTRTRLEPRVRRIGVGLEDARGATHGAA